MNIVKAQLTYLASPFGSSDTAGTLVNLIDSQGNPIQLSDFGTWFVLVMKSGTTVEIVYCTGLTQNADNSASFAVGTNGRDMLPKSPYTGTTVGQDFPAGAEVFVTNDPYTMSRFVQLDNTNVFTVTPQSTGGNPTMPTQLVTKAYADALVLGTLTTLDVIVPATAGATIIAGQLIYLNEATGRWNLAEADMVATVDNVLLGIAQGAGTNGVPIANGVLLQGVDSNQSGMTQGNIMYASNTPGTISSTPGTEQVTVGIAKDTTNLYFAPRFNMELTKAGSDFLGAVTGMSMLYNGTAAPAGFLDEDGSLYANNTYPALLGVLKGNFGVDSGTTFTGNSGTHIITATGHGLSAGQILLLTSTGTLPAGLSANTLYYVINTTTNTFQLSATIGGSAIAFTDTGSGTHSYHTQFKVPDSRSRTVVGVGQGTVVATIASITGNVITLSGLTNANNNEFQTGQAVVFGATTAGNLTNATTYYVVRVSNTTISLATSIPNATAAGTTSGNPTVITLAGTEAGTLTLTLSSRSLADTGGEEYHAMALSEVVPHIHRNPFTSGSNSGSSLTSGGSAGLNPFNTDTTFAANGTPSNNMQPFTTKRIVIKT